MVFFFSSTTPLGIVIGIGLSRVYSETSPTALYSGRTTKCLLSRFAELYGSGRSPGMAADFMGPKLQTNMKLQAWSYVAVLLGAGLMSLLAKWA